MDCMTAAAFPTRSTGGLTAGWARLGDRVAARAERIAAAAVTPLVPADYLDLFHPLRASPRPSS